MISSFWPVGNARFAATVRGRKAWSSKSATAMSSASRAARARIALSSESATAMRSASRAARARIALSSELGDLSLDVLATATTAASCRS